MGILSRILKGTDDSSVLQDRKTIDELDKFKKYWEARWYLAMAFYDGVHFTYPKKDSAGNWQRKNEVGNNKVIREIPKAKKQIKSIRNLILKVKQRPVVYPNLNVISLDSPESQKKEEEQANLQGKYIQYLLEDQMKINKFKKTLIKYAALYSVAYIQIINENGKKSFKVYSPFEISIYPNIVDINESPSIVKHIPHKLSDLENNKLYDQDKIQKIKESYKNGKYSNSIYLNSYMTEKYGTSPDDNIIVDELYQVKKIKINKDTNEQAEDTDENTEIQNRVKITAYIGTEIIREDILKISKIPISMFVWEDEPYETSFMEELMPLNKAYDIFISKLEHKVKKLDTGRLAIQKGEDQKIVTTNDGEFYRWKRFRPEMMAEAGVPNAFMELVQTIENDMKEIGVAMTSAAALPTGVNAWRAIESLKATDYGSIGTQQDNLNECLTDLTEKLIEMVAYDMTHTEKVLLKNSNGKKEIYKIIGKRGSDILGENQDLSKNTIVVNPNRTVKVEIESDATWTEEGKRGLTLELVEKGILPKSMALESLKYGNIEDIIQKLIEEQTYGTSIIDTNEFKVLPVELQQAIIKYLAQGAGTPPIPGTEQQQNENV